MASAYVLMIVKPGTESDVAKKLVARKEVKDISIVYGQYDLVMKVETADMKSLQDFILGMRKDKNVENTTTMIAVK